MTLFELTWLLAFLASFAAVFSIAWRLRKIGYPRRKLDSLLLVLVGVVLGAFWLLETVADRIGPVAQVGGEVVDLSHARGRWVDTYRVTVSGEPPVTVKIWAGPFAHLQRGDEVRIQYGTLTASARVIEARSLRRAWVRGSGLSWFEVLFAVGVASTITWGLARLRAPRGS